MNTVFNNVYTGLDNSIKNILVQGMVSKKLIYFWIVRLDCRRDLTKMDVIIRSFKSRKKKENVLKIDADK